MNDMGSSDLLLAGIVLALGGLVFGYELGIISGALLQLKAEFRLSCVQQEALVSSLLVGALLASILGGYLIDRHGRRTTILLGNVLVLTGSVVLMLRFYWALVLGRVIVGFAVCVSSMSCCIFVSELVSPDHRGVLVTLYEAGVTVGILGAYAVNYLLSDSEGGWRWMFGLVVVPTLVQLVSICFLPSNTEEPSRDRTRRRLMETQQMDDPDQFSTMYLLQSKDNMRVRTVIGLGLVLYQQFTGQPTVLFYASTIFHSVGYHSDAAALLASVGLGVVKVLATVTSMLFSDRVGRRPLLITGCSVMAVCLMTIGLLSGRSAAGATRPCVSQEAVANATDLPPVGVGPQSAVDLNHVLELRKNTTIHGGLGHDETGLEVDSGVVCTVVNWIILFSMMGVVSAYAIGFGPMTWLLLSEIFPAAVRGRAFAFANGFNWAANLLVTSTFLDVTDAIGLSGLFVLFGLVAVAAAVFFSLTLPETKGKSLEDIDQELRSIRFDHVGRCWAFIRRRRRSSSARYQRVRCDVSASS
ncbi:solute carrier family 2, facilitated glucose transporter member 10 [Sphaeramia orbicularis]|uniref:Solute carrier family 2, facilitated glucose transporter member 10 n=1 Tax=Sphaeramia orbicularis TaxID=375764 RepID=A0A673A268_9TELE|nr:solute carrier family 2, facilitated glucose transporter member 10 [Sphaeramia orbicularis]